MIAWAHNPGSDHSTLPSPVARLRARVEAERDAPGGDSAHSQQRLSDYERESQAGIDQRHGNIVSSFADYSDTDYMGLTSRYAFNAAAPGTPVAEEVEDKKTEAASAANRLVRIQGLGVPKLS